MKIKKIEINNFRNYCGYHQFLLDKNITILFGENGFGKSSFFDAIEWCITSEIERFKSKDGDLSFTNYDCVNQAVRHEETANCYVSIYYDQYKLHRIYEVSKNQSNVYLYRIKGEEEELIERGQKKVEAYLYKNRKDSEMFGTELIKHSYILSQDQVTNFIRSSPKNRFDSLASIMGLDKITNFIDNLKTYATVLDNFCNDLETELKTKKKFLEDRSIERYEYYNITREIKELREKISDFHNVENSEEIDQERVSESIDKTNNKLIKAKRMLKDLNDIPSEYTNYIELKEEFKNVEDELNNNRNLLLRVDNSKSTTSKNLELLVNKFDQFISHKGLIKNIEKKKVEIEELEKLIVKSSYNELSINQINQEFDNRYKNLQMIDYALLNYEDFKKATNYLKQVPLDIETNENKFRLLQRRIYRINKRVVQIKKWLDDNDSSNSLQELIQYLKGMFNYVKNNETKGFCPLCSTPVGNELENRINSNITKYASKISEKEIRLMRVLELKERKEKELFAFEKEREVIKKNSIDLQKVLEDARYLTNRVTDNKLYNDRFFKSEDIKDIEEVKDRLLNQVNMLKEIRDTKKTLSVLKENYHTLLESIDIPKINGNVEASLEKRKKLLNRKEERLICLYKSIEEKIEELKSKQVYLLSLVQKVNNYEMFSKKIYKFENVKSKIDMKIAKLNQEQEQLNQLKNLLLVKKEKEVNLKVINRYEAEIEDLDGKLKSWSDKKNNLNIYIKKATASVGKHAIEFLNHPNSKIQQYYRYLNPVPSVNGNIQFVTDNSDEKRRGLSISIPFKKENGEEDLLNVRYTLSSAQLNTLAISIFLVVNDSQDIGIFDFVAIDDPIQNMDDVNRYTMCDILGEINKQIIFSTHDMNFLKLFIKKNEHKKKDIRVYFLENPNLLKGKVREVTF
ncbi:SMC family ATPase [Priestia megaterium]|uniref:SMC family ATPase n=1 Tax=Priestia megaterium TaxID=1404 RepID=UPI0028775AC1|nr:SMC family ATPase [Priestia megaterium]MBX4164578.1 SMC family ATPase [Priestia megaterium]